LDPQLSKEMHADINIIINNFERLAAKHPHKITVRTPVIHQYTADLQNIMKISVLMKKNGVKQIELLAYNPYTPHYYDVYGIPFDQQKYSAVRDDEAAQILNIFSSNGINVKYIE
ncbi:MAG: hypothetical protein FWE00_10130, partial [Defluviitaleaceae bacterium]|nr:hypothetical protein [Defluviitaleaceae bacterium]